MKLTSVITLSLMMLSHVVIVLAPAMRSVKRGQYPYLVLIRQDVSKGTRYYTGTLLSLKWVLTLSEIMHEMTTDQLRREVTVFAGITRFADIKKAQRRDVTEFYKTVAEGKETYPAMLLLKLEEPFTATQSVRPVQVNNGYIQRKCVTAGWSKSSTPSVTTIPELVQVVVDVVSTEDCGENFNAVSYESQVCAIQSYEYSFFPGSAMLCSNFLTAIKSVDTYMSPDSSRDRIILYVRAKKYTTWMRAHVLDMKPMVVLPKGLRDNLMETWEEQKGSKRSVNIDGPDNESNGGSVISHSAGLALSCMLVAICRKL